MKRGRVIGTTVLVLSVLALAGGLAAYKYRQIRAAMNQPAFEPMETVTVGQAQLAPLRPTISIIGTVAAVRSVTLKNEVVGTVKTVGVTSGQIVKAGDVLLQMCTAVDEAQIEAAEASVRSAQANIRASEAEVALANTNVRRLESAVATNAAPQVDLDRARAEVDRARSALDRDKAAVAQAEANILPLKAMRDKKTIRAPFGGRVGIVDTHLGQYLAEGTEMTTLTEVADSVFVDFAVPQALAVALVPGSTVGLTTEAGGSLGVATVVAADARIDRLTRNATLRATASGDITRLAAGASVRVAVPTGPERQVVAIPVVALRKGPEGDHVYRIEKDEQDPTGQTLRAKRVFVVSGPSMNDMVLIREGLQAGEQIATSGSFKLRPGVKVAIAAAASPAASGGAAPTAGK
jgi:membrane fusion protein (multidrug efflux system)